MEHSSDSNKPQLPGACLRRAIVAVALLVLLAFCRTTVAGEPKVVFRSQDLLRSGDSSVAAVAQRQVVKAFLERYPQYEIEPFAMPALHGMESGSLMSIAAGLPPHAIYVNFRSSSTYLEQGFLEPLDVLLARVLSSNDRVRIPDADGRWTVDPTDQEIAQAVEAIRKRLPEPAWPVVYRKAPGADRPHVYAIPTANLVMALVYRKDLFRAAGLDPQSPPADWAELLDFSRKLTQPSRNQYGLALSGGSTIAWSLYSFLISNGGRVAEQDAAGTWRVVYDTRQCAESVDFLYDLMRGPFERDGRTVRGSVLTAPRAVSDLMWQRGQIGMQLAYLSDEMLAESNPQLIGIAPVPRAPGGGFGSELNCKMLGAFSDATPEQKLAVMRYIWFVTGEPAQAIRTRVFVEAGLGEFLNPSLLKQFGYEDVLSRAQPGWQKAYQEALQHGVPEPYGYNTQSIWRVMSEPVNAALELPLDQMPPEQRIAAIQTLLSASVQDVNLTVLNIIPPAEMTKRRVVALIVIVLMVIAFIVGFRHIWKYFGDAERAAHGQRSARRFGLGYLFLLPGLVMILWWEYVPLGAGLTMSMLDYRLVQDSALVGVDNFAHVLFDASFWMSLWRTFYFLILMVGLGFWPPILLAILLQEVPTDTLKYVFRTVYYLPAVLSGVVVMFLWRQLYDLSENGTLNQLLMSVNGLGPVLATAVKLLVAMMWVSLIGAMAYVPYKASELSRSVKAALVCAALILLAGTVGIVLASERPTLLLVGTFDVQPLRWIESPELAMLCVVIPTIWAGAGPGSVLYLAALKTVPNDLYEAADLDGASHLHKVVYIVLPQLRYLIVIQLIAAIIGAMKGGADYILALTGGGPNDATNILALEIFTRTFLDLKFGIGTAMSWILGALLIGVTAYQMKMLARSQIASPR